jgi:copper(I)-binding protein
MFALTQNGAVTVSDALVKTQERHKIKTAVTVGLTPTDRTSQAGGYHLMLIGP